MKSENLESYLRDIICGLVDKSDEVEVVRTQDEMGVLLTVRVADGEWGKVIGRDGSIASAIKTIMRAAGFVTDSRVSVKIDAPYVGGAKE